MKKWCISATCYVWLYIVIEIIHLVPTVLGYYFIFLNHGVNDLFRACFKPKDARWTSMDIVQSCSNKNPI